MKWLDIVLSLFKLMGPELRKALTQAVEQWEVTAKETKSPVDDLIVAVLHILLGM